MLTISTITNTGYENGRVFIHGDQHELLALAKTLLTAVDKECASTEACTAGLRSMKVTIMRRAD